MTHMESYLIAMLIIFTVPYLIFQLGRTERYAPMVVVQTVAGVVLGPGMLGTIFPDYYSAVFSLTVVASLNGIGWWAVMIFIMLAGIELDLAAAWKHRRDSSITAGLALGIPLLMGSLAAIIVLNFNGWIGAHASAWQFVLGIGMACAVTALPVLMLLMEKHNLLRHQIGQRVLRYASVDDIAIWAVLSIILLDVDRLGREIAFFIVLATVTPLLRKLMIRVPMRERLSVALIWMSACSLASDWSGLHFMVGAFVSGAVLDKQWFGEDKIDMVRQNVLALILPVYFLSTGLKTNWSGAGMPVLLVAGMLLLVSVAGKLGGSHMAGRFLGWRRGEASIIGWLLQTKGLVMIIFANILLDKAIISNEMFTALLLMSILSTMLTGPMVAPKLRRLAGTAYTVPQQNLATIQAVPPVTQVNSVNSG
jgi:Kef-type K+ transport system membrane component KefB